MSERKSLTEQLEEHRVKEAAERRRTALHESGHAVVAHLHGLDVRGLAVYAIGDEGQTRWELSAVDVMGSREDFARAVDAGSVILWVRISQSEKEPTATAILKEHGGLNVHTCAPTSSSNQQSPG